MNLKQYQTLPVPLPEGNVVTAQALCEPNSLVRQDWALTMSESGRTTTTTRPRHPQAHELPVCTCLQYALIWTDCGCRIAYMGVQLLYFDGCPHWAVADELLRIALSSLGRESESIEHVLVVSDEQA